MTLVECVPNFSEGRRPEVIDQIVAAIAAVDGVHVLDRQSDATHNRCVITFVGPDEAAAQAAFGGIAAAARLIDLTRARRRAPALRRRRRGAVRAGARRPTCRCACERRAASPRASAPSWSIPAYLYEDAARRPEHRDLADVRRGEFEGLREAIVTDPGRAPDEGPGACTPRRAPWPSAPARR